MLVNACRPRHTHLHIFYVRVLVFVCACVFFFFFIYSIDCFPFTSPHFTPSCIVSCVLDPLGVQCAFRRGGQSRDHQWKATADSWVIKVLERLVFSACIFFQAFLKSVPACLLYQGLGIESRAVGQPSGPRPLLSSCENASTFTLSLSLPNWIKPGRATLLSTAKEKKKAAADFQHLCQCQLLWNSTVSRLSHPIGSPIRREISQAFILQNIFSAARAGTKVLFTVGKTPWPGA